MGKTHIFGLKICFFFDLKTFLDEKKILFVQITTNIVETPAQLNTTSTAGGVYMKMTVHHPINPTHHQRQEL